MFLVIRKKHIGGILCVLVLLLFVSLFYRTQTLFAKELLLSYTYKNNETLISEEIREKIHHIYQGDEKIAYLTFDDGPTRKVTPKVLDILKELDVKANFFVVGKHVEELPELVLREYEEGHFIANHGYSHNNTKLYQSRISFLNEVILTDLSISKALSAEYKSHLFRFPNGSMSKSHHQDKLNSIEYLKEIDYTYLDWNCLNNDSIKKYSSSGLLNNLKASAKNKNVIVILMHDTGDVNKTYDVLEDSILYLKEQDYEFRTFYDFIPNP